jgi:hypothetical protein
MDYASLEIQAREDGQYLVYSVCENADKQANLHNKELIKLTTQDIRLRVTVSKNANCLFSYSTDGKTFTELDTKFIAKPGKWVGAKVGIFCSRAITTNDAGYALFDFFRIHKNTDLK